MDQLHMLLQTSKLRVGVCVFTALMLRTSVPCTNCTNVPHLSTVHKLH